MRFPRFPYLMKIPIYQHGAIAYPRREPRIVGRHGQQSDRNVQPLAAAQHAKFNAAASSKNTHQL